MRYDFHPEALEEYEEATLYYAERDPTLARRIVDAVIVAVMHCSREPGYWQRRLVTP